MKPTITSIIVASLLAVPFAVAEDHDHDHKHDHDHDHEHHHDHAIVGPNGGRVLHDVNPHAELFVTKDRKIQITFIDGEGKAIAPEKQTITVTCGKRSAPTRMSFEKKGKAFISDKALPAGLNIPAVVQIKMEPDGKKETIRLNLNLEECPTCDSLEYACTCDHS